MYSREELPPIDPHKVGLSEVTSPAGTMPAMNKVAPFLWFNDNAEEAAEFYLSVFPHARRLDELRSKGAARARENFDIFALPEDAFNEINRIQTRQRLNDVVNTGSPGFIPRVKSA